MKNKIILLGCLLISTMMFAQSESFQTPPDIIKKAIDAAPAPTTILGDNYHDMIVLRRDNAYYDLEDIAFHEHRIGGLRLDERNASLSRQAFSNSIQIKVDGDYVNIKNLPEELNILDAKWSPSNRYVGFTNTLPTEVEIWIIDTHNGEAKKINDRPLNRTTLRGNSYMFLSDEEILYTAVPFERSAAPDVDELASGPAVQEVYGKKLGSRTIADVMNSPADEAMFDYLTTSHLRLYTPEGSRSVGEKAIYSSLILSPDKKFFIAKTVHRPYSYLTGYTSFPSKTFVMDVKEGNVIFEIEDKTDSKPKVDTDKAEEKKPTPRGHAWRLDKPSSLYWSEKALPVETDKKKKNKEEEPFQTSVYELAAPFTGEKELVMKAEFAYGGITWGTSDFAIYSDTQTKGKKSYRRLVSFNPSNPQAAQSVLYSKSTERDKEGYTVIGRPYTKKNQYGNQVLYKDGNTIYFTGTNRPDAEGDMMSFIDAFDLNSKAFNQVWIAQPPYRVSLISIEGPDKLLVSRQSPDMPSNYAVIGFDNSEIEKITEYEDPFPELREINREFVTYKREDGVTLTAVLYTPKGYNPATDGTLPVFMWGYPYEYRTEVDAQKNRAPRYGFTANSSAALLATQGYAVMMDVSMYIISKKEDSEPNDVFIKELVSNAEAAIDYIVERGIGDRHRIGIGGHSYGAFMTAHLLSQSDLFAAGVARSGAYNRTLTPYGFQSERRTYWEDPEVYFDMSPFTFANNLKEPVLILHGGLDENSGTFPVQSQRLYHAISFHGGTARYVVLPYDTHGYRAKENNYQLWWETINWLDKYVKNAKAPVEKKK